MVVVTGATGHLGTVLVRLLADSGTTVRCVARPGSTSPGLELAGVERIDAGLHEAGPLEDAMRGATVVYHVAGRISLDSSDAAELHRVNVDGTRSVLVAAARVGVGRVVHVGSIEAFHLDDDPCPVTEDRPIDPDHTIMEYGRSKALGIRVALEAAARGMDVVVCCPTAIVGPPDYRVSAIGRFFRDFLNGRLPAYIDGGFDFVDVRDVAAGLVAAAERGASGRVYLLSGEYVTVPAMIEMMQTESGVRRPLLQLPIPLIAPFLPAVEGAARLAGRRTRFTAASLKLLALGVRVDSSRARAELGYTTRPIRETVADTVRWFREHGG